MKSIKAKILIIVCFCVFTTGASAQTKTEFLNLPKDVIMSYGDEYTFNIDYRYVGNDNGMKAVFSVSKDSHGFEILGPYYKDQNIYTLKLTGRAKILGTHKYSITINNSTSKILTGDINLKVFGLEFATTTFPTIYGIKKPVNLQIPYKYDGKQIIRFSYVLPNSIEYHEKAVYQNTGIMNLNITPNKTGNFKIDVIALGDNPYGTGNLVMSRKTFNLTVKNENEKPIPAVLGVATTTKATSTMPIIKKVTASPKKVVAKKPILKKVAPKKN